MILALPGKCLMRCLLGTLQGLRVNCCQACEHLLPGVRLFLHLTKVCFSVAGDGYRGYVGSLQYHWLRFLGKGRTSYVALIMKLSLKASMSHSSFQQIFIFTIPSDLIHCLCLGQATAFSTLQPILVDPLPPLLRVVDWLQGQRLPSLVTLGQHCLCAGVPHFPAGTPPLVPSELTRWGSCGYKQITSLCQHCLQPYIGALTIYKIVNGIILSSLSTFVIGALYIRQGGSPNCRHQNLLASSELARAISTCSSGQVSH